jgi:hypothetical protein
MKPVLAAFALVLAGCTSPCVKLAQKLCECETTTEAQDNCKTTASEQESLVDVSSEDEDRCSDLIDGCDCHAIDTPQGKIACGLSRP